MQVNLPIFIVHIYILIKLLFKKEIQQMCASVDVKNFGLIKTCSKKRGPAIPEIFQAFDFATVDIIERLLCFTPDKRLNVEEVLAHPFFFR
jgi:hypothetical protein